MRDMVQPSLLYPLLALFLVPAFSGCATQRSTANFPDGIRVLTFTHDYANSHLVVKNDHAYLVDTGMEENGPELAEDLRKAGFPPEKLRAIILTHGHADHAKQDVARDPRARQIARPQHETITN